MGCRSKTIVVVGSINTDFVVTTDRLPLVGGTIPGNSFATFQGGKGANQAVAAARLGASVILVGKVGSDSFGAESVRQLRSHGINCDHIAIEQGDSGLAVITVASEGHNTIIVVPGANAGASPAFIESKRSVIREAGIVLAQLEIPVESVVRLAEICEEEGVPLMLDPAPAKELPADLLKRCSWFTPNETEAAFYAFGTNPLTPPEEIVAFLRASGAQNIVLKQGERGAYLGCVGTVAVQIPPARVTAVDSTAAGDTYNGAFATALVNGHPAEFCGRFAAAAAAISVTRAGAQASMPTLSEVESQSDFVKS
jgi:ribokinase